MNITCISDIHLNTFTSHEFYPGFRNEQYLRAADRVIEIAQNNNSKILCILGDLIDSPIITPKATHLLTQFVSKFDNYFDEVYYILGQHDVDSKVKNWHENDTIVTLLSKFSSKFKYVNNKIIEISNKRIYFRDFMFETDIINDVPECDIYLGHVTLSTLFGQTIDPQPYKLGIFGDIHAIVDMGINHSVGGFLQKNMSDYPYGQIITIDLNDLSFKRTPLIDNNHHFLRIYNEGDEINPDEYTVINKKTKGIESIKIKEVDNSDVKEVKLSDLDQIIIDKLKSLNLLDIHQLVVPNCKLDNRVSFNFKLKELVIHNFRSINDYTLNFEKYPGLLFISGDNGSGKSSLLSALYVALVGDRRIRVFNRKGFSDLQLSITLEYNNNEYKIVRGCGFTKLFINGSQISKGNKTSLDAYIAECIPFIKYLYIFRLNINPEYFQILFNSRLIYKLFGVDNFKQYHSEGLKLVVEINKQIKLLNDELLKINGSLQILESNKSSLTNDLSNLNSELLNYDKDQISKNSEVIHLRRSINELLDKKSKLSNDINIDLNRYNEIKDAKLKLSEAQNKNSTIKRMLSEQNSINTRINKLVAEYDKLSHSSNLVKCPNCGHEFDTNYDFIDKRKEDINKEVKQLKLEADEKFSNYDFTLLDLTLLEKEVAELTNYEKKLSDIKKLEVIDSSISEYQSKLSEYLINSYYSKSDQELMDDQSKYSSIIKSIESKNSELNRVNSEIDKYNLRVNEINSELSLNNTKLERRMTYCSIFDESNPNSIHKEVLLRISESLSDDEVSFVNQYDEDSLGLQLKVADNWIDYINCSSGQRTYMDLKLLNRLISLMDGCGVVFLDEVLGSIKDTNIENCLSIIRKLNVNNILMISHNMTIMSDYDSKLNCQLVNGCSRFN